MMEILGWLRPRLNPITFRQARPLPWSQPIRHQVLLLLLLLLWLLLRVRLLRSLVLRVGVTRSGRANDWLQQLFHTSPRFPVLPILAGRLGARNLLSLALNWDPWLPYYLPLQSKYRVNMLRLLVWLSLWCRYNSTSVEGLNLTKSDRSGNSNEWPAL